MDEFKDIILKEFCEEVGLKVSYGIEFSKMCNLMVCLKKVGLDVEKL